LGGACKRKCNKIGEPRAGRADKTLMSEDTFCGEDLRTAIENDLGTRVFLDVRFRVSRSDSLRAISLSNIRA